MLWISNPNIDSQIKRPHSNGFSLSFGGLTRFLIANRGEKAANDALEANDSTKDDKKQVKINEKKNTVDEKK